MPSKDPDKLRAKRVRYYAAHRAEHLAKQAAHDTAHREEKMAYLRAYRRGERRRQTRCVLCEALLIVFQRRVCCPLCDELPAADAPAMIVL